jgi:hypothetical protein
MIEQKNSIKDNDYENNIHNNNIIINDNDSQNNQENQDNQDNQDEEDDINNNLANIQSKNISPDDLPEFVFSVIKLGKLGFSHKKRILHISVEGISYYRMVSKNDRTKDFLDCLNNIYEVRSGETIDQYKLKDLAQKFKNLPEEEKKIKSTFRKYHIITSENVSSFKTAPITVRNDEETDLTNPSSYWIMETREMIFRELILKAQYIINDAIKMLKSKRENIAIGKKGKKNNKKEDRLKDNGRDEK